MNDVITQKLIQLNCTYLKELINPVWISPIFAIYFEADDVMDELTTVFPKSIQTTGIGFPFKDCGHIQQFNLSLLFAPSFYF